MKNRIANRIFSVGVVTISLFSLATAEAASSYAKMRTEEISKLCSPLLVEHKRLMAEAEATDDQLAEISKKTGTEIAGLVREIPGIDQFISSYKNEADAIRIMDYRQQLQKLNEKHLQDLRTVIQRRFSLSESLVKSQGARVIKKPTFQKCQPSSFYDIRKVFPENVKGSDPVFDYNIKQLAFKTVWSPRAANELDSSYSCYSTLLEAQNLLKRLSIDELRSRILNQIAANMIKDNAQPEPSGQGFGWAATRIARDCTSTLTCQSNPEIVQKIQEVVAKKEDDLRSVRALNSLDTELRDAIEKNHRQRTELTTEWLNLNLGKERSYDDEKSAVTPCDSAEQVR